MKRIGILHYQVGRTDGVSLEIDKWQQVLENRGHEVFLCAGDLSTALAWPSDINASIGTGGNVSAVLSAGSHTITASATDAGGVLTGEDRRDHRLTPSLALSWARRFGSLGLEVSAAYAFLRQWSNSAEYDARAHQVTLGIGLDY